MAALSSVVATGAAQGSNADASLAITRVRVLVAHAKVGYIHEQQSGASAEIERDRRGADGRRNQEARAHRDFSLGSLPTGTYGGAEIELQPLDASADTSDPTLADFVSSSASLLVEGT